VYTAGGKKIVSVNGPNSNTSQSIINSKLGLQNTKIFFFVDK
jgi:hypothetical protein